MRNYELVVGLETHVELATKTKIFCGCSTAFGAEPNTHCCPVCTGQPGALPKLNKQAVRFAIMAGLALNCSICEIAELDRKNYVYPDLPKAYQISEFDKPLCIQGDIPLSNGRTIRIHHIHIEEDAGKLIHDQDGIYIDYNRGGVPLIEIVSEPDFRSSDEVREYLEKIQLIMKYLQISDAKMQEGSMRCDVNISVRPEGTSTFGTRTEIKNMNSISYISKALAYEKKRQIDIIESGGTVVQETRRYDEVSNKTESMRGKENTQDYRYFREPDLVPIHTLPTEVKEIKSVLPELPDSKLCRYREIYGFSEADSWNLLKYFRVAEFLDKVIQLGAKPKTAGNFMLGQVYRYLQTEEKKEQFDITVYPQDFASLCQLVDSGKLRMSLAKNFLEKMLAEGKNLNYYLSREDLEEITEDQMRDFCKKAVEIYPKAVEDYRRGKDQAIKSLIGYIMKETHGRADALQAENILREIIG